MALKFFWRCEGTTLDGTHDYSDSDTTASMVNSGSISSTAARIGTNGILGVGGLASAANFTSSGIFPGTTSAPADSVGSMACSVQYKTALPGSAQTVGIGFRGTSANDSISMRTASSGEFRLYIGNTTSSTNLSTSAVAASIDNWYGVVVRWDLGNDKRAIEVYNSSGSLLQKVEDTSTDLATFVPSEVNLNFKCGQKDVGNANDVWTDNCFVSNSYDEPLQTNLTITSYTEYSLGLAPIRLIWRM